MNKITEDEARLASDGLDYLTNTARAHDYADDDRINAAAEAVAHVLDAHDYRIEPCPECGETIGCAARRV